MRTVRGEKKGTYDYHTMFSNNSFDGELYLVKFYNDETLYAGIPIAHARPLSGKRATFSFNIIEPEASSGVFRRPFHDIEYAVRKA